MAARETFERQPQATMQLEATTSRELADYNPVEFRDSARPASSDGGAPTQRTLINGQAPNAPAAGRPQKYSHGFFDTEIAPLRKIYFKILIGAAVMTILVMWACLPFYWGSLWKAPNYAYRLKTFVVDFDNNSSLSQAVISATEASRDSKGVRLGYQIVQAGTFANLAEVQNAIHEEEAWAAIVVNRGASAALQLARETGNSSYSDASAVTAVYSQGRNELAAGNYILPQFQAVLTPALAQVSAQSIAQYLQANSGNATAINLLAQAPTTVLGYSYSLDNIHPYNVPVATAVTLVGLIYLLILSFIQTMAHFGAREVIGPFLTTKSYLILRCVMPLVIYFPISFFYSMINLAFEVPFGQGPFTHAGGFFLAWFMLYLGMASLGLATEFAITFLTPKFIAFFLVAWIVLNVSETSVPIQVSGSLIYRIGYGLPFYNINTGLRTIIFGTKNHLGRTFGILLGWIGLSLITIPIITWVMRRSDVKKVEQERREAASSNEKTSPIV